jgi:acetyl-CoA carboxylase biotin carboxyl carrier protein
MGDITLRLCPKSRYHAGKNKGMRSFLRFRDYENPCRSVCRGTGSIIYEDLQDKRGANMKLLEIREIIRLVNESSIDEFLFEQEGFRISIQKPAPKVVQGEESPVLATPITEEVNTASQEVDTESESPEISTKEIVSRYVGVFSSPLVQVGDRVEENTLLGTCRVASLNLSHDFRSDVAGEVVEILAEEGQVIEYGQPVFRIKRV